MMKASTDSLPNSKFSEYIPRTDEAEYARAVEAARVNGLGDINLSDDETREYEETMGQLGFFGDVGNEIGDRG